MDTISQTTAVIRQRGQLTIPDKIRATFPWLIENAVVVLETLPNEGIIVKPYHSSGLNLAQKWQKAWEAIQLSRSFKGKRGNLSEFVVKDRQNH